MYVGRFAPSPTGPLHFGSLVAALFSYLRARQAGGRWLVRIEDLDPPRQPADSVRQILAALTAHGLVWDEPLTFQSQRSRMYDQAIDALRLAGLTYQCTCSRSDIQQAGAIEAEPGMGSVYPGTCRARRLAPDEAGATRVRVPDEEISFEDALQGEVRQALLTQSGDFIIRRRDGLYSYNLAVAVDDAEQGITEVARGTDLLMQTPRQIFLQRALGAPQPRYLHFPVAVDRLGQKLSKQTGALPLDPAKAGRNLILALTFLGAEVPPGLANAPAANLLEWATGQFDPVLLAGQRAKPAPLTGGHALD